ncbi:MAG: hypothetical protein IKR39_03505 [Lachnospiraceae bacterium]|nr:hypothetical protein [Lachnospiraceae bacterium]
MNYFDVVKQNFLCHNIWLLPICIVFMVLAFLIRKPLNKVTIIGKKRNSIIFVCVAVVFYVLMYAVNIEVSKCIAFYSGWDMGNVTGSVYSLLDGHTLSEDFYYRLFPFNIFNVYYLYKLFGLAKSLPNYPYNPEFIWIQFSCLLFSLSGLLTTLSVRRITRKAAPTIFSMLLYAALLGISPWKTIPYTDTISFSFGILAVYLFICSREIRSWRRYILWGVICIISFLGAQIKATVYVPVVALTIIQIVSSLSLKGVACKIKNIAVTLLILALCFGLSLLFKSHVFKVVGYDTSQDLKLTWSHLVRLGSNEYSTGGFSSEHYVLFYDYLDRPAEERHAEERRQIAERFRTRGLLGNLDFYLRKNVMNYNDGTFCWYLEGNFHMGEYGELTTNRFKPLLRDFFWYEGRFYRYFLTYSQLVWLFTLLMIPCCTLLPFLSRDADYSIKIGTVVLVLLGITLFVTLFEGRARYFLNMSPVFVLAASLGLDFTFKKSNG